jgi:lipopolysaccharide/colanic/teichoic acid biosynthesis glycosyltransferase
MLKRAFDLIGSLGALIVFSPVFLVAAILIKLDSSGPIFYKAKRIGKDGKPFTIYKFRTMVANAAEIGPALTYNQDPRITRVGRFLRRTHIDEWPQFLNILKGEMSFVGPRPEAPIYVKHYTPQQREVLKVKPGMTGLAQVKYMMDEASMLDAANLDEVYLSEILPRKLELDLQYIQNRSLLLDLKLLIQTVLITLIRRSGSVHAN